MRPASKVMRLEHMGSFHQTRISFARTLVRRMAREGWRISQQQFDLDDNGYGIAVYRISTPIDAIHFVAFSNYLEPSDRTDRVIAEKWDVGFILTSAEINDDTLARLRANVPKQEAGRCSIEDFILSRANKSVRVFEYVVNALANGRQPDVHEIAKVGYLLRTTAVYGNGKFGLADFEQLRSRGIFKLPFQAELLTVYMARHFSLDLVQHIAKRRNRHGAVALERSLCRGLGVGNATGLGMAPFLSTHPKLIHRWIRARELALARVRAVETASAEKLNRFNTLLQRAQSHVQQWRTDDERQSRRNRATFEELSTFIERHRADGSTFIPEDKPWNFVVDWADRNTSLETAELLNTILVELYPELVDELENETGDDELTELAPQMPVRELKALIEDSYDWAIDIDFGKSAAEHFFWYWSAEKLEPRLGVRNIEPGDDREMRIDVAREVYYLHQQLCQLDDNRLDQTVAEFLLENPNWRRIIQRIQSLVSYPYAEVRDNIIAEDCLPINLLRCKLSIFGATKFDPKSDRWTRITLFQGAPLADEFVTDNVDDWSFPIVRHEGIT